MSHIPASVTFNSSCSQNRPWTPGWLSWFHLWSIWITPPALTYFSYCFIRLLHWQWRQESQFGQSGRQLVRMRKKHWFTLGGGANKYCLNQFGDSSKTTPPTHTHKTKNEKYDEHIRRELHYTVEIFVPWCSLLLHSLQQKVGINLVVYNRGIIETLIYNLIQL